MPHRRAYLFIILGTLALVAIMGGWLVSGATAAPLMQDATPTPQPGTGAAVEAGAEPPMQLSISDEVCLGCHGEPGLTLPLENGESLELYVPAEEHQNSVHGQLGYACVQCHTTVGEYPHPPFSAADARDASLQLYTACQRCHAHTYELAQDSVHAAALADGNRQAAICTDCHTAHTVRRIKDPETGKELPEARVWIPQTCALCHNAIYQKYKESVHGSALIGEGNPDVPTCIDCHGVHNIGNPTTNQFRLQSPEMCAKCHTDPKVMGKYGISTDVLRTYVADFHGTTVELFQKQSPDAQTNKPVCYDCHGVHDIASAEDPQKGLLVRENLLARCQVCHPDATVNFPDSWMSHYIPSPEKNPWVYYVNLFYKFFIPGTLGGMALLVALDLSRSLMNRYGRRKPATGDETVSAIEAPGTAQDTVAEAISSPETGSDTPPDHTEAEA